MCVGLGLLMSLLTGFTLWSSVVQSVCIGMLCWLGIDLGRLPLARWVHRSAPPGSAESIDRWPGWLPLLPLIMVSTLIGFTLGDSVASWLLGQTANNYFLRSSWHEIGVMFASALIPGLAITYFFYSRETLAAKESAVQTAQRQAAEHQLKLLESQLEPHMLFNTLATLRVLIASDPKRAQTMLDQLIGFLRGTLGASRASTHPLALEFARLGDYLALMQIRMGERLQIRFDLPADLAGLPVPPLLLQPLVENSIKHGLETKVEGGRIEVGAARVGDLLVLTVRDTGNGLSEAISDGTRFGLAQVRERLQTLYGPRATLSLANVDERDAEGGTLATIHLPIINATTP
jgi:sensor histidine kinase YesM